MFMLVPLGVVAVSPWKMIDPDALMRLAAGRAVAQHGAVPQTDPFTFVAPNTRWHNPEWLGDLLWYAAHSAGGDPGAQALKLLLLCGAFLLALGLARRQGAAPILTAALLLLLIPGLAWRFTLRNHLHALWLIPLYGLVLEWARQRPVRLLLLLPLGALWANLHGSFPLAWVMVAAAAAGALATGRRLRAMYLLALLGLQPLLGVVSPHAMGNYQQVLDHVLNAADYRALILEWRSPLQVAPGIMHLPLLLLGVLGALSFAPRCDRGRAAVEPALLLAAALALGLSSLRFVPAAVMLAAPAVAANISRWLARTPQRLQGRAGWASLAVALALLSAVAAILRTDRRPTVLHRPGSPAALARFLGQHAPPRARLFNQFDSGQHLLWLASHRVKLYIDPRNNQGAAALRRYVTRVLPDPRVFDEEARRLYITLAEVNAASPRSRALAKHLARSPRWRRVFVDGDRAVYARDVPANRGLIPR